SVTGDIVAMTVLRIEVHQVGEDQSLLLVVHGFHEAVHAIVVSGRRDRARDATAGKQVPDLAYRSDGNSLCSEAIEQGLPGRVESVIVRVLGPLERPRLSHDRAGNDATDVHPQADEVEGNLADSVQLG